MACVVVLMVLLLVVATDTAVAWADACHAANVSAGDGFTCAVLTDGSARCWGDSSEGQLGRANITTASDPNGPPLDFGAGRTVLQLAAHLGSPCAVLSDLSLSCWGTNGVGQLGLGNTKKRKQPTHVPLGAGNSSVLLISTGSNWQACAAVSGTGLLCWGSADIDLNGTPWLGIPNSRNVDGTQIFLPSKVDMGAGSGSTPDVSDMCAGDSHTCILTAQHVLKCWGTGSVPGLDSGQLGLGNITNTTGLTWAKLPSVDLGKGRSAVQVACGYDHTCAVLDNGALKCWGSNTFGQLGYGNSDNRGGPGTSMGDNLQSVDVGTGRTVKQVSAGGYFCTCALLDNGQVKCWGDNDYGQLGRGCSFQTWGERPGQMGDHLPAVDLGPGRSAVSVSAGYKHTCAVLDDGSIKCWGDNTSGQLGFNSSHDLVCQPSQVVDLGPSCTASTVVGNGTNPGNTTSPGNTSSPSPVPASSAPSASPPTTTTILLPPSLPTPSQISVSQTPPTAPQPTSSSSHSIPTGAVAGAVVAAVAVVAIIGAGIWWWRTKAGKGRSLTGGGGLAGARLKQQPAQVVVVATDEHAAYKPDDKPADVGGSMAAVTSAGSTRTDARDISYTASTPAQSLGLLREGSVDDMRIPWSHITLGDLLGEGGFGKVYKAKWQMNTVAVKALNVTKRSRTAVTNLHREALIMSGLKHPCIARVFGVVDEKPHHALVMQYYPKGTLARYMTTTAYAELELPSKLHIALQWQAPPAPWVHCSDRKWQSEIKLQAMERSPVACAFLHERPVPVLHGDLKAANILLSAPGRQIAIADFGLSQAMLQGQEAAVASGALTYSISPPEVLNDPLAPRTRATDVYAFAIVLLEIYTAKRAFGNLWPEDIKMMVITGGRPELPADMPECVASVIQACWAQDPASRPSFADVVQQLAAVSQEMQVPYVTEGTIAGDATQTMTGW